MAAAPSPAIHPKFHFTDQKSRERPAPSSFSQLQDYLLTECLLAAQAVPHCFLVDSQVSWPTSMSVC
jgi:hypothetical protein